MEAECDEQLHCYRLWPSSGGSSAKVEERRPTAFSRCKIGKIKCYTSCCYHFIFPCLSSFAGQGVGRLLIEQGEEWLGHFLSVHESLACQTVMHTLHILHQTVLQPGGDHAQAHRPHLSSEPQCLGQSQRCCHGDSSVVNDLGEPVCFLLPLQESSEGKWRRDTAGQR